MGQTGTQPEATRAADASPDMVEKLCTVGEHSILINRLEEAAWCFERAGGLAPDTPRWLKGLARTRHLQERPGEARALMARAIACGPDTADSYTVLGQICQAEGDFSAAADAFRQAIAIDPRLGPAQLRLALLGGDGGGEGRIAELTRLAQSTLCPPDQRAPLAFALGRLHEAEGDHERAFASYKAANDLRRAQYPGYSDSFVSATPMMSVFGPDLRRPAVAPDDGSDRLVFVVGMMRSGTTLVEQILASHPLVHGHGERPDIRQIAAALPAALGGQVPYPECLRRLDAATAAGHAARYLARLERDAPVARRHIDKLPHNFEQLGLISLLFPNARIIHCARDARDTCVSNYFQDFGHLNPFTYDLGALGDYHREYARLMAHWDAVLPNPMLTIPYEALVGDQEGWSRRAVAFLGLDWDDACLAFHRNTRPVYTKSLWQVRQPIFTGSIGRWRPYRRHLGALFDALGRGSGTASEPAG